MTSCRGTPSYRLSLAYLRYGTCTCGPDGGKPPKVFVWLPASTACMRQQLTKDGGMYLSGPFNVFQQKTPFFFFKVLVCLRQQLTKDGCMVLSGPFQNFNVIQVYVQATHIHTNELCVAAPAYEWAMETPCVHAL